VVVTSDGADYSGIFVWHLDAVTWSGSTSSSSHFFNYIYPTSGPSACTSGGSAAYATFTWTQQATGSYDINVWGQNLTSNYVYTQASLFNASASALPFVGKGSITAPVDPCDSISNGFFMMATEYDDYARISAGYGSALYFSQVPLVAGRNYTIVVSTDQANYFANFGVTVAPTIWKNFGTTSNFQSPENGATPSNCANNLYDANVWQATSFTVAYPFLVVSSSESTSGADALISLYSGNNAGSANQLAAPLTCTNFLGCGDEEPVSVAGFAAGSSFTAVAAPYSQGNGAFPLWIYTGVPVESGTTSAATSAETGSTTGSHISGAAQVLVSLVALVSLPLAF
jgi:hypothetical protein